MKRNPSVFFISILILVSLFGSGCTLTVCSAPEILVTRTDDTRGGRLCTPTSCSLRQAVTASNICPGAQTIRIPTGTYNLTTLGAHEDNNNTGDLDILDSVNIVTVGMPVIDGNNTDRVLDIKAAASVQLTELIIQNGQEQWGGGIMNEGTLFASKVLIQGNHDSIGGSAAGVFNGGNATFTHSAIVNNISFEQTGGVQNTGRLKLDNVTISGNRGYGVQNGTPISGDINSVVEVTFSTIADNPGAYEVFHIGPIGNFTISNSIIAGHVSDGNCFAPITSLGFNIDTSSATSANNCGLTLPSDMKEVDPILLPLGSYGGSTPSRALDLASPALDSADPAVCGGAGDDQRGVSRPQGPGCDRGAFELDNTNPNPNVVRPTNTPTNTPLPTPASGIIIIPSVTPEPGTLVLILDRNANCRKGPGSAYDAIDAYPAGQSLVADGRNEDVPWWWQVKMPNSKSHCWVSSVAGMPQGDFNILPIAAQAAPAPGGAVVDADGDGYPAGVDCNDADPKINPGAVETPKDSIDSNCNGDDNK